MTDTQIDLCTKDFPCDECKKYRRFCLDCLEYVENGKVHDCRRKE